MRADSIAIHQKRAIVKTYKGRTQARANKLFQKDIVEMESKGYVPVNQMWIPDKYHFFVWLLVFIECLLGFVFILFFLFVIVSLLTMSIRPCPFGTLSVTYELRNGPIDVQSIDSMSIENREKKC